MRIHGIGIELGEFGYGKLDIGSCEDIEVIERARKSLVHFEIAEFVIFGGRFEFRALFERSRCKFGVRHIVFDK